MERSPVRGRLPVDLPESRGFLDGSWYVEERRDAARLAIRIRKKLHEERSPFQKIAVYETAFFGKLLALDDLVMLTERDEFVYHEMLAHVPLCRHPRPRSVLIIGGGDCGCLREVLRHPCVERVVQCEIDERVTAVCREQFAWTGTAADDPRAELVFADGVRHISDHRATYDVVLIDSTDPVGPAAPLFDRTFYRQIAETLKPGGLMAAQTESGHWTPHLVSNIYRELRAAFAHVSAYWGAIPTYPSGSWTWALASPSHRLEESLDAERARSLEPGCRYYTADLHRAAFVLPAFVRDAAGGR